MGPFHVDGLGAAHVHATFKTRPFPHQAAAWQRFQVILPLCPGLEGRGPVLLRAIPFGRAVVVPVKVVKSRLAALRTSAQAPETGGTVEIWKNPPPPQRTGNVEAAIDRETLGCSHRIVCCLVT